MLIAILMLTIVGPAASAGEGRGGFMGFIAGCCFGLRAGVDYNGGKELHWREWVRLVPIVNLVVGIWDGLDCAGGLTRSDLAAQYGSQYY